MSEPYTPPKANLTSDKVQGAKVPKGIRFLALCMMVGAIVSIGTIAVLSPRLMARPLVLLVFIPFVILFLFYIVKGISLWKGKANAYSWAFWLFVIQIPFISFPGFSYHLYTGFLIVWRYGDVASNAVFNLGGGFNFYLSQAIKASYFGVNIFALIAAAYIWWSRPKSTEAVVA